MDGFEASRISFFKTWKAHQSCNAYTSVGNCYLLNAIEFFDKSSEGLFKNGGSVREPAGLNA